MAAAFIFACDESTAGAAATFNARDEYEVNRIVDDADADRGALVGWSDVVTLYFGMFWIRLR